MENLVSIIIPVFNAEKYILDALNSVKEQTYPNIELLIIDDKSQDNSIRVIEKFILENPSMNIKFAKIDKNSGTAMARNLGLKMSSGRFISYLDADDKIAPEKIQKQVKFMLENKYAFTYTSFSYMNSDFSKATKTPKLPISQNYKQAMKNTILQSMCIMIDTEKIDKQLLYMPNVRMGEDAGTWWNILKTGVTAYNLNEVLGYYRRGIKTKSSNKLKAIKRTWNLYRKTQGFSVVKSAYYFMFYLCNNFRKRIF